MKIRIEWLFDSHDCETCGGSYAEGAKVFVDDALRIDLTPHAYCFDGADYPREEVFSRIIKEVYGDELTLIED